MGDPATTVTLTGPVTLAEASRWREALLDAFAGGADVRIDLEAAGPWDVAGLQLVLAALATGRRSGHPVRLTRVPRVFRDAAGRAGLADVLAGAIESRAE